jgi:glycosyltransferase involved in cell wall biosynthesis
LAIVGAILRPVPSTVSIVMPVFNADPRDLTRALHSVATQTSVVSEFVVVDDGSTEPLERRRLISQLDGTPTNLRLLRQTNAGPGPARNAGASIATSDYLSFLDADDALRSGWMEAFLRCIATSKPALVSCSVEMHLAARGRTRSFRVDPTSKGPAFFGMQACLLPGAYVVRRKLFLEIGGFDPRCTYGEHHELGLRLAEETSQTPRAVAAIREILVDRNTLRSADTTARYAQARLESSLYILEKHKRLLSRDKATTGAYLGIAGVAAAQLGRRRLARSLLMRSALAAPSPKRLTRAIVALAPNALQPWSRPSR